MRYEVKRYEDKILELNKALYRLKQTPWYSRINDYFLKNEFVKCPMNILSM